MTISDRIRSTCDFSSFSKASRPLEAVMSLCSPRRPRVDVYKRQAVLNAPAEPKTLFYRDESIAVLYLPKDLEKNRYGQTAANIGVFYDNTNSAQTAELKAALNEIVALENQKMAMEAGTGTEGGILLHDRILFNPVNSTCNCLLYTSRCV